MAGTVFLSCGQNARELKIASKVEGRLKNAPFNLNVFVARATNNLYSLNSDVLERLAYADYFIFINFRRKSGRFPGSLYSHQELAMALALGHSGLLIFSEVGAPNLGVLKFMVPNRPSFSSVSKLLAQISNDVELENWQPSYSRFLRAHELVIRSKVDFLDGAGNRLLGTDISVVVENQSNDLQENVMVHLEAIDGNEPDHLFRSPLKVSGQRRYDAAIPPKASVIFNILIEGERQPVPQAGAFLVSALDLSPLPPLFSDKSEHTMQFRIDARARRPIRFKLVGRRGEYSLQ
jgi:hypothetical protein